jgi:hypothetical protein
MPSELHDGKDDNAIKASPGGMRVTTCSQALSYAFSRFMHVKILQKYHRKERPSPAAMGVYLLPFTIFMSSVFKASGLNNATPALACCQMLGELRQYNTTLISRSRSAIYKLCPLMSPQQRKQIRGEMYGWRSQDLLKIFLKIFSSTILQRN